jgi:peroxin-7
MIFKQQDLSGTSVKFSPIINNQLAYGGCQNFGLAGNSLLSLAQFDIQMGHLQVLKRYPIKNSIQNICFSENNPHHITVSTGAGQFLLFDTQSNRITPLINIQLFDKEAASCSNNRFLPSVFCVGGVKGELALVDIHSKKVDMLPLGVPGGVNEVIWHPNNKNLLGVATSSGKLLIKNLTQGSPDKNVMAISEASGNILSFDFNKYNSTVSLACIDNTIKIYDLKQPQMPVSVIAGHSHPITRVRFSPFSDSVLASASYDMTVKGWDLKKLPQSPLMKNHTRNREFITDLDFSMFHHNYVVTSSLDKFLNVFHCLS